MLSKIINPAIFSTTGILVGVYASIFINKWTSLSIANQIALEVSPLEILSILISILLAIYVARTLSKKNDLEKNEKDLLINYFSEFKSSLINKVTSILQKDEFDTPSTKSDLKVLRKRIDSILNLAHEFALIDIKNPKGVELEGKVRDIWELLTDCPQRINGRANASVKQGVERLRLEQVNKVEVLLIDIEKIIFQLTMEINRK